MFTSIRNRFNGWNVRYRAASPRLQVIAKVVAVLLVIAAIVAVFFGLRAMYNSLPTSKPKVTSSLPLDASTADKMVTAIEAMKQEMLKQRGDLNEARTEVKGVKKKVDDLGGNLDNLQKGSDALKKRLDDVLESIKNAPKATPMSKRDGTDQVAAVKPDAPQVAASEPKARVIPLDKQEPAQTEPPKAPIPGQPDEAALASARVPSERLPAIGRLRYARVLRDCDGVWTPAAGKERENIKGFNEMPGEEFDQFTKKCLEARTAMNSAQPPADQRSDPRSYPESQQGAVVADGAGGGNPYAGRYDYSQMRTVVVPRRAR